MKLSVSAYRAHASAHKKILSSSYQTQLNYGSTAASSSTPSSTGLFSMDPGDTQNTAINPIPTCSAIISSNSQNQGQIQTSLLSPTDTVLSPGGTGTVSLATSRDEEDDSSNQISSDSKSPGQRTKSNQRWMKLRTTVQISSAMAPKKPPLKREDSFLQRFSTRHIPETQETIEDTSSEGAGGDNEKVYHRKRRLPKIPRTVVNPDENFFFYWLMALTGCVLYNLWTLIVRQSFPELQEGANNFWFICDCISDFVFIFDVIVQLRTGYLEQGLMVYDAKKLAKHYLQSRAFFLDLTALVPLDILQIKFGSQPLLRFPRFFKVYRAIKYYYIVESRTVWPNLWRVINLIHILLILAHWFGCFYFLLSEAEGFQGDWVYPYRPGDYATLTRKYLGSLYWSTLTLTTIGDLPTPETNAEPSTSADGPRSLPRRGLKSRLLQFKSSQGYIFTIVSYLIGVFIFATIVGQVGNVITNRNANRLEFERLLDGAKTYMRHHKVPGGMKRRVLRWYDYSWSRGRIQGGGDINTALGLLPDKLKTELALHVNLSVLKKVTIFQECQPEFLHDLVLKMKAYIFTPGDSICRKGEVAREMFIIADGILDVLSETGKVLTTMKAGDFFGEIGILNLDGLNKRTADVRSVGYSELFSLSREDVLAAMKDYPEAQEILQTLGRKRLMEVRCINKKHAKHADKVREARGLKNVLRKSRTGRKSDESIELQPIHSIAAALKSSSKGVLRRMPRVKSDDIATEDEKNGTAEKTPSPIGAGLPLLQRLRLLKEKQDREERAAKTTTPMISPPHTHVTSTLSPQESIQEEPEPEIIGPGLPILQRLKLLKNKEDKLKSVDPGNQARLQITPTPTQTSNTSSIAHSLSPTSPTVKVPTSPNTLTTIQSPLPKTYLKVSFRERIKNLQQDSKQEKPIENDSISDMKQQLIPSTSSSSSTSASSTYRYNKPSTAQSLRDKIKSFSQTPKEESMKPWSKLKLATVVNLGGSYSNLNNTYHYDEAKQLRRNKKKRTSVPTDLNIATSISTSPSPNKKSINQQQFFNDKTSVSDSEVKPGIVEQPAFLKQWNRTNPFKLHQSQQKSYTSVNDLSPEYSGLPFVKKLKILNERQKLAELESVIQTRSFSLDCTDSSNSTEHIMESLTRSHSEASGMARPKQVTATNLVTPIAPPPVAPITIPQCLRSPLSPESNETLERRNLKSILKKLSEDKLSQQQTNKLTTITKSSSSSSSSSTTTTTTIDASRRIEMKKLMRAQTLEGYVARHSKFMKSVTFNRNTLSSPPNSANMYETIEERSFFPILSAQPHTDISAQQQQQHSMGAAGVSGVRATTSTSSLSSLAANAIASTSTSISAAATAAASSSSISVHSSNRNLQESIYYASSDTDFLQQQEQSFQPQYPHFQLQPAPVAHHHHHHHHHHHSQPPHLDTASYNNISDSTDDDFDGTISITKRHKPNDGSQASSVPSKQRRIRKGTLAEQEYFGEVLIGIKQIIKNHLKEIQGKFYHRFEDLELAVQHKDSIISELQTRLVELETLPTDRNVMTPISEIDRERRESSGTGSTGSSAELPFMRGDSLDTIFASSPPSTSERPLRHKLHSRKKISPRHQRSSRHLSWEESSDQESFDLNESCALPQEQEQQQQLVPDEPLPQQQPPSESHFPELVVSNVTGNLLSDSVVVDIEDSSSSNDSKSDHDDADADDDEEEEDEDGNEEDEEEVGDDDEDDEEFDNNDDEAIDKYDAAEDEGGGMQPNDWEVRMLAAEMSRKRKNSSSRDNVEQSGNGDGAMGASGSDDNVNLLRRRRKCSDTDTDFSENEAQTLVTNNSRPRASSLDQHNLNIRRGKNRSVIKAMSFDRDKDRL